MGSGLGGLHMKGALVGESLLSLGTGGRGQSFLGKRGSRCQNLQMEKLEKVAIAGGNVQRE